MKKLLIVIIGLFISYVSYAQDVIYKNDKTEIKAKVLEITDAQIKYKKFELLDGPTYNINIDEVFMIIYKNGQKEIMAQKRKEPATISSEQNTSSMNNNTTQRTAVNEIKVTASTVTDTTNSKYRFNKAGKGGSWSFFDIGFNPQSLNTPGVIVPNVIIGMHTFLGKNLAFRNAITLGYSSLSVFNTHISVATFGNVIGVNYYLNELIKIPKDKASFFVGASVSYITSLSSGVKEGGGSSSSSVFGINGNFGGRYHLSKKFGILAQVDFSQGGAGILAGISFLRLDGKKNKK